jgi:hypothetical protein
MDWLFYFEAFELAQKCSEIKKTKNREAIKAFRLATPKKDQQS